MRRRDLRAARLGCAKRQPEAPADFDAPIDWPEPTAPQMTPEQRETAALDYQRDAIAENAGPFISDNY